MLETKKATTTTSTTATTRLIMMIPVVIDDDKGGVNDDVDAHDDDERTCGANADGDDHDDDDNKSNESRVFWNKPDTFGTPLDTIQQQECQTQFDCPSTRTLDTQTCHARSPGLGVFSSVGSTNTNLRMKPAVICRRRVS